MNHRFLRLLCLLCACLLLAGCGGQEKSHRAGPTLPPVQPSRQAPENDMHQSYEQTALLYLPTPDGTRLSAVPVKAPFSTAQHRAESLCQLLLTHPGTESTWPVGGDIALKLSETEAVEVSGEVITVSLGASALRLSHEQLFTVGQALANTLCQFHDASFVNVLIAGAQPGLNTAATLPAGSYRPNTREDLSALWGRASAQPEQGRRAFAATLYFPAPSGKGIFAEGRSLNFQGSTCAEMARTLLDALSAGAESLPGAPKCPDLGSRLMSEPELIETGGSRRLKLHFVEELNQALINAGITRSVMMGALTCTMTTFLPGLDGIEVEIGREKIHSVTPSGTYFGAGETISFPDGLLRRQSFSGFLLSPCTLFFANEEGKLQPTLRAIPFYEARNPRALVQQLMLGPQPFDSVKNLLPVLPEGLRDADLLGVSFEDQVLTLNFSNQLPSLSKDMDGKQERLLIYGMVNTLIGLPGVQRVEFFIMGSQPDSLAGEVFLPGSFLPNFDLIAK